MMLMRLFKRIITLAVLGLLLADQSFAQKKSARAEDGSKLPKLAQLNNHGDFLFADGVWRADNSDEKTDLAVDSVTHLECYKSGGRRIVGSEAYCMEATATIIYDLPDVNVEYLRVVSWDNDRIIA